MPKLGPCGPELAAEITSEELPALRAFLLGQARGLAGKRELFAGIPPSRSGNALLLYLPLAPGHSATREQASEAKRPAG